MGLEELPLSSNELKHLGYLATKCCLQIIQVTYNPDKTPMQPGMDQGFNPEVHWLALNEMYQICGTNLWSCLLPEWVGCCTLGLAFAHGNIMKTLS